MQGRNIKWPEAAATTMQHQRCGRSARFRKGYKSVGIGHDNPFTAGPDPALFFPAAFEPHVPRLWCFASREIEPAGQSHRCRSRSARPPSAYRHFNLSEQLGQSGFGIGLFVHRVHLMIQPALIFDSPCSAHIGKFISEAGQGQPF